MFSSSGFFRGAYCPFYQHGLCHRPYCHFKHAKMPVYKKELESNVQRADNKSIKKIGNNVNDDSVIKNHTIHTGCTGEIVKSKEKRVELGVIETKLEERCHDKTIQSSAMPKTTGLIDTFYQKKERVTGTFTSHVSLNEESNTTVTKQRRICDCDDPDCCGFIEEDEEGAEGKEEKIVADKNTEGKEKVPIENPDISEHDSGNVKLTTVDLLGTSDSLHNKKKKKKKKKMTVDNGQTKEEERRKRKIQSKDEKRDVKKIKMLDEKYDIVFLDEDYEEEEQPVKNTKQSEIAVDLKPNDYISIDSVAKTGQGSGKKRVAHSKEEVLRASVKCSSATKPSKLKKLSYISPGLAAPIATTQTSLTSISTPLVPASMGFTTEDGVYVGKKRVSHAKPSTTIKPPTSTTFATKRNQSERPKLIMEMGGKVPHMLRQKYLDKIIDEFIPKCESESVAIEKGFADEKVANERSSRKQIYMNLCANIIKRIRSMPDHQKSTKEEEENATTLNPMIAGTPTIQSIYRIKGSGTSGYKKVSSQGNRKAVKPVSSSLVNATKPEIVPNKVKERRTSEPIQLNEESFYDYLQKFLLNDGQSWENGYPRYSAHDSLTVEVKDYTSSEHTLRRNCCRCGKQYFMNKKGKYVTKEECRYHWGKLRKKREARTWISYFSCCQADDNAEPCSYGRLHVCNKVGPLSDYVSTDEWTNEETKRKVFSIDCEMCYTTQGLELTRVTVVDFYLAQIIDLFVKPDNPIVDYNTKFSGVTKDNLKGVDYSLKDIQEIFMNIFDKDTILMGHSLESDLKALKIVHRKVVDTALVFPHRLGLPFKRALKTLMAELLHKIIQDGEGGHDSCEDARSCMELMKLKFNEDAKAINRTSHTYISSTSFYSNI